MLVVEHAPMEAVMLPAQDQARDENGRALVVRNGKARARSITLGSGTVQLQVMSSSSPSIWRSMLTASADDYRPSSSTTEAKAHGR